MPAGAGFAADGLRTDCCTTRSGGAAVRTVVLAVQLAEVVAGDVFQRADRAGDLITMELVHQRLAELRAHPPGCRCGHYCDAVPLGSPEAVWRIATTWQRQCNSTRARGRR